MRTQNSRIFRFPEAFAWGLAGHHVPPSHSQRPLILDALQKLDLKSYQCFIDWAFVEPQPEQFNTAALDYYQTLLKELHQRHIHTTVTLFHNHPPQWFNQQTPWHTSRAIHRFNRYSQKVYAHLSPYVNLWIPFHELNLWITGAYLEAEWEPKIADFTRAAMAYRNCMEAHAEFYHYVRNHASPSDAEVNVGLGLNIMDMAPARAWHPMDHWVTARLYHFYNLSLMEAFETGHWHVTVPGYQQRIDIPFIKDTIDFVHLTYFQRLKVQFQMGRRYCATVRSSHARQGADDTKYASRAMTGLARALEIFYDFQHPIYVSGIMPAIEDQARAHYLHACFKCLRDAIKSGVPVRGFYFWPQTEAMSADRDNDASLFSELWIKAAGASRPAASETAQFYAGVAHSNEIYNNIAL